MGEFIRLTAADGHESGAYLAKPDGAPRGGLIVGMEMYGVNGYVTGLCDAWAAEGYACVAPALFDRLERALVLPYDEAGSRRGKALSAIVDHAKTVLDVEAAAAAVRPAGRVAIMGFCFGGTVTWIAACRCALDAGIAYYGSDMCDYADEDARCPVICHVGALDNIVPPEHVAAFEARHPDVRWYVYPGAHHGFDNRGRPARYSATASALARARTRAFLAGTIG